MINEIINLLENIPLDTREQYLDKLAKYKEIIDKTPNKFLDFHLNDSVKKEHYELAQHIKDTANFRGFVIGLKK